MTELWINSMAYPVTALGPGRRAVIWTVGCRRRCSGCISPELQEFDAGKCIQVDLLLRRLLRLKGVIDGITITGGEPFEQPEALNLFMQGISKLMPEWNVLVYTGYKLYELSEKGPLISNILNKIDVLIDGEYRMNIPADHPLKGSGNQRIYFLTGRGRSMATAIEAAQFNSVNFGIGANVQMIIGIANQTARRKIHGALGVRNPQNYSIL